MSISNKEQLKSYIHGIHNFIRNSGAGYGMVALKIFYLFYGLKLLEKYENPILDEIGDECRFSKLLAKAKACKNEDDYNELLRVLKNETINELFDNEKTKVLFHELPTNLFNIGKTYAELIIKIENLFENIKKDDKGNDIVDLKGKVYEYFIGYNGGNDQKSELGQHFTDRHISEYSLDLLDQRIFEEGKVISMVDPYGGSGGFTLSYINRFNKEEWTQEEVDNIYHFDISEDVIKCVALEVFAITGKFPNRDHNFKNQNSFKVGYEKKDLVLANPPYGGDKTTKSPETADGEAILNELKKDKYKDKPWVKKQIETIKRNIKKDIDKNKKEQVNFKSCGDQIREMIIKYGLQKNCNDKESCSLIHIMDLLDEGGTAVAVLKEGVFFDSKYSGVRKALIDNFDVKRVVSVPSDEFENTTTKTSLIHFVNNGQRTKKIEFLELKVDKVEEDKFVFCEENQELIRIAKKGDIEGKAYPVPICSATYEQLSHIIKTEKKGKSKGFNEKQEYSLSSKKYDIKITTCSDDYTLVKLGDLCDIDCGFAFKSTEFTDTGIPILKIKDLKNNILNLDTIDTYTKKIINDKYKIKKNDIIISMTGKEGSIVSAALSNKNLNIYINQRNCALRNIKINLNYFYFVFCKYAKKHLDFKNTGSIQVHISPTDINETYIPIPKDDKKLEHWVKTIGEPFTIFTEGKEKLKDFEEKIQEEIKDIIENEDYDEVKLGDLCELKDGYDFYRNEMDSKSFKKDINYPLLKINSDSITDYVLINKKYNNYIVKKNDIVIGTKGSCGKIRKVLIEIGYHKHGLLRFKNFKINKNYIYYQLKLILNDKFIEKNINKSVLANLKKENLLNIKIKIPKNKSIIEALEPKFKQIEELQENINNAEKEYHFQLEELNKDINLIEKREGKEESKEEEKEKYTLQQLMKLETKELKEICKALGIEYNKNKKLLAKTIIEFQSKDDINYKEDKEEEEDKEDKDDKEEEDKDKDKDKDKEFTEEELNEKSKEELKELCRTYDISERSKKKSNISNILKHYRGEEIKPLRKRKAKRNAV